MGARQHLSGLSALVYGQHGYDISNYTDIDPIFGTLAEFDAVLGEVHAHGMKLLLDDVANHTSDRHSWLLMPEPDGPV